ncbi:hypothetical protein JCM8547_009291 [Rhodosporidiobolus lusitaniae]
MAVSLAPPTPAAPPATLLATLQAFTTALQIRRSLLSELDQALSSFLSPSSSSSPARGELTNDVLAAPSLDPSYTPPPPPGQSACLAESLSPPPPRSDAELQQVLQLAFAGLVEVKEDVRLSILERLGGEKEEGFGRGDLERVVREVEERESERVKATLELYQLRRLLVLTPSLSSDSSIASTMAEKETLRADLARRIQEEMQEIQAEITDLKAAEQEEEEGETSSATTA